MFLCLATGDTSYTVDDDLTAYAEEDVPTIVPAQSSLSFTQMSSLGVDEPYVPGVPIDITVAFTKTGPAALEALSLQQTLPAGWTVTGVNGAEPPTSPGSFPQSGPVTFSWSTVPSGSSFGFVYTVLPPTGAGGDQQIAGTATYTLDGVSGIQFGPVAVELPADDALTFSRSFDQEAYFPGHTLTVSIHFAADWDSVDLVELEETLPVGWTYDTTSVLPAGVTRSGTANNVTFDFTGLSSDAELPILTYKVNVPSTLQSGEKFFVGSANYTRPNTGSAAYTTPEVVSSIFHSGAGAQFSRSFSTGGTYPACGFIDVTVTLTTDAPVKVTAASIVEQLPVVAGEAWAFGGVLSPPSPSDPDYAPGYVAPSAPAGNPTGNIEMYWVTSFPTVEQPLWFKYRITAIPLAVNCLRKSFVCNV